MFHRLVAAIPVLVIPVTSTHPEPVEPVGSGETRDPRTQPLTVADALFSIPSIAGRMQLVGDLDGDGRPDLVTERGEEWGGVDRIDAVSALDGHTIRTLWSLPEGSHSWSYQQFDWDAGGDVDSDGVPDLIVGLPTEDANGSRSGAVSIVSGADGRVIREIHGVEPDEHRGWSVAFLGDIDGDGYCEYAMGSPQCDVLQFGPLGFPLLVETTATADGVSVVPVNEGELLSREEVWKEILKRRSADLGVVSVRSGHLGISLWHVHGETGGHAFGVRMRSVGDADGDGHSELLVGPDPRSGEPLHLLSGKDGKCLGVLANNRGPFGAAGDVDGDGNADIYLDTMHEDCGDHLGSTSIVSARGRPLMELVFPDMMSEFSVTVALGDVDGDHTPDFLLGDANFHIPVPSDPSWEADSELVDVRSMSLEDALALDSRPWAAGSWESGAAWVYSGRTKRVILGAWGTPGSRDAMGLAGAPMPDITGDGYPEIAICDSNGAHVFAGPGPDPLHEPK